MSSRCLPPLLSAILIVGALTTLTVADENKPPEVSWQTDYAAAMKDSKALGKPLLLFFTGSDWCSYCKKLEKAVLHEAEGALLIEADFIPVMLDYPQSFKLSEELTSQNEELRSRFKIEGFPTLVACHADEKPFGKLVGYSGDAKETIQLLNSMAVAGGVLAGLPDDVLTATTTDLDALEKLVTNLSVELLAGDWLPYLDRALALTPADAPSREKIVAVHEQVVDFNDMKTWTDELVKLSGGVSPGMMPPNPFEVDEQSSMTADMTDALAFIEARTTDSVGKPKKIEFLKNYKVALLSAAHRWDDAIALKTEIAKSSGLDDYTKTTLKRDIAVLLIQKGDCDKATQLLTEYHSELVALKRDDGYPLEFHILRDFLLYRRPEITARLADKILAEHEEVPKNLSFVYIAGDLAYRFLGVNLKNRARCLLEQNASSNTNETIQALRKADAAVCYRALGSDQEADEILASIAFAEESIPFGEESSGSETPLQKQLRKTMEAAHGSQAKALRFLAGQANVEGAKRLNAEADALEAKVLELESR